MEDENSKSEGSFVFCVEIVKDLFSERKGESERGSLDSREETRKCFGTRSYIVQDVTVRTSTG